MVLLETVLRQALYENLVYVVCLQCLSLFHLIYPTVVPFAIQDGDLKQGLPDSSLKV